MARGVIRSRNADEATRLRRSGGQAFVTNNINVDIEFILAYRARVYLKRLTVGGFTALRINRNFRKRRTGWRWNTEFTCSILSGLRRLPGRKQLTMELVAQPRRDVNGSTSQVDYD